MVHFYNPNDGKSYEFSKDFEEKAQKLRGIVNFAFVNCKDYKKLCDQNAPKNLPSIKVFPPQPIPAQDFDLDLKKAINQSVKYLKNYVQVVKEDNFQGFLKVDPTIPKVLYFTDNEKGVVPLMLKALSSTFNKKLSFGIVKKNDKDITEFFNVKQFPTLMVQQSGHNKPSKYEGEFNFKDIYDFLNIFSQQFVPESTGQGQDERPWLFKVIPEMHQKSAKDVCLG